MRRIIISLSIIIAIIAVTGLTLPWWWGVALRVGGPRAGLTFGDYSRQGYYAWILTDVVWAGEPGKFTAQRIQLPNPLFLLLRGADAGPVKISGWQWVQSPTTSERKVVDEPSQGWASTYTQAQRSIGKVIRWIPDLTAEEGILRIAGQKFTLARIGWAPAKQRVDFVEISVSGHTLNGQVAWDPEKAVVRGQVASEDGNFDLVASAYELGLTGEWWQQPLTGSATFADSGWWPLKAELSAPDWNLPGSRLKLDGRYSQVHATGRAVWDSNKFNLQLTADGMPVADADMPELKMQLEAQGNRDEFTISLLEAHAPGLTATLNEPVTLGIKDWRKLPNQTSEFSLNADLAVLTEDVLKGKVTGGIQLDATQADSPRLKAELAVDDLRWHDEPAITGHGALIVEGDIVRVSEWTFKADDGSRLNLVGSWNWRTRQATKVELDGEVARRWVARWLPQDLEFQKIGTKLAFEGTWPELKHAGRLELKDLVWGATKPSNWTLEWTGEGKRLDLANITGEAGKSHLRIKARHDARVVTIDELTLGRADGEEFTLQQPATLRWAPTFELSILHLTSAEANLELTLGKAAEIHLRVGQVGRSWLDDWIALPGPDWTINRLALDGLESDGIWQGRAELEGGFSIADDRSAQVSLDLQFDPDGLVVTQAKIGEGGQPILQATGMIPLALRPTAEVEKWKIDEGGNLKLNLTTTDNAAFWRQVDSALGLELLAPNITATLDGTWSDPEGEVHLQVGKLRVDPKRWGPRWPEITAVQAKLHGGIRGLELQEFNAEILGQAVRASGQMPLDRASCRELRADPLAYLRNSVVGQLEIPSADLAAWAAMAPKVIAPTGHLSLLLAAKGGGAFDGKLTLNRAATRPLGPLGALQDVEAVVRFDGRNIVLDSMQAQSGGRPVMLKGDATWLESGEPKLNLTLSGNNLPLVRQTGLLLRGDLDLRLQTEYDGITWVRGGVVLRDGLFLVDLQSLRPSGGRGAGGAGRPPYFSVLEAPFADWQLDLNVSGERFLRMETPVFSGKASAHFQLQGSLREPRAIGEATIVDGRVKLPFATFVVGDGWVRLRQSDPYVPEISVIGTARRLGYDLRMELTGTALAPKLQFYSSPPLASEEVLLLVMTGEAPADEVTYSSTQRAAKLGAYFGQSLLNQFTGHRDGEDRLVISTGEKVSRGGRETYRMEYDLNGRWSLIGEYDEFDDYNAGLKWKLFSSDPKEETDVK